MEEGLVNECYICLEPCDTISPCACETRVHPECLMNFLGMTENTLCTICKTEYDLSSVPSTNTTSRFVTACLFIKRLSLYIFYSGVVLVSYIIIGIIGQSLGNWLHITSADPIKTIWSAEHALAAISLLVFVGFVYLIFGRGIRNTV